jgi:hypothetical protein
MTEPTIRAFVAALKREMQAGGVAPQSEQHLRREFAALGWSRDDALHAAKVDEEIARLQNQARVLSALRDEIFGAAPGA